MAFITLLANTISYTGYFAPATPLEFASNQWFALKTVPHISLLPRSVGRCNFLAKRSSLEDNFTVFEKDLLQKSQTCNFFVAASFLFQSCCRLDQSSVQQRSANSEKVKFIWKETFANFSVSLKIFVASSETKNWSECCSTNLKIRTNRFNLLQIRISSQLKMAAETPRFQKIAPRTLTKGI